MTRTRGLLGSAIDELVEDMMVRVIPKIFERIQLKGKETEEMQEIRQHNQLTKIEDTTRSMDALALGRGSRLSSGMAGSSITRNLMHKLMGQSKLVRTWLGLLSVFKPNSPCVGLIGCHKCIDKKEARSVFDLLDRAAWVATASCTSCNLSRELPKQRELS